MVKKISNIKERVLYIAEIKGITKESLCADIGMTYGNFKGTAKNTPLNSDAIVNLLTLYPDINLEWLIIGEGEPLKSEMPIFQAGVDMYKFFMDEIKELSKEVGSLQHQVQILSSATEHSGEISNRAAEPELREQYRSLKKDKSKNKPDE